MADSFHEIFVPSTATTAFYKRAAQRANASVSSKVIASKVASTDARRISVPMLSSHAVNRDHCGPAGFARFGINLPESHNRHDGEHELNQQYYG
ncbi:MAG: hypothetical protein ACREHD_11285 [Pirellulales bacterium]